MDFFACILKCLLIESVPLSSIAVPQPKHGRPDRVGHGCGIPDRTVVSRRQRIRNDQARDERERDFGNGGSVSCGPQLNDSGTAPSPHSARSLVFIRGRAEHGVIYRERAAGACLWHSRGSSAIMEDQTLWGVCRAWMT
jgi:hypothetical protein